MPYYIPGVSLRCRSGACLDRDLCEESTKEQSLKLEVASEKSTALKSFQVKRASPWQPELRDNLACSPHPSFLSPVTLARQSSFLVPLMHLYEDQVTLAPHVNSKCHYCINFSEDLDQGPDFWEPQITALPTVVAVSTFHRVVALICSYSQN